MGIGPPYRTPCDPSVGATLAVARNLRGTGRRGRRPLRLFTGKRCVGVGLPDDPYAPGLHRSLPAGHAGPALQKFSVGRDPCVPPPTAALANLSWRASDRRHWCGNPYPRLLVGTARSGPAQILMPVLRISPLHHARRRAKIFPVLPLDRGKLS